MADPLNIYAIDDVAISTGFEIVPFISKASVIKKFINPQDGRIITRVGDNEVDMRVSILPVVFGEKVVIRILDKKNYKVGKEHLVFSTLHTNDAPSSIVRLVDMGIQPYLVSTSIAGIIAQRLVRKICPKCRQAYEATSYEKQVLGVDEDKPLTLYKGKGCGYCNNTGYSGRTGVYEVMEVTRKLKEAITSHKTMDEIRDISVQNGMSSLGDECKKLVLDGVTTMNELATITILKEI